MRFSPFRRTLARLKASDLAVLRDTPEGWWVEYKSKPNGRIGIAKSISAFANSEGGWLFYGVDETEVSGEKVAGDFPGVPVDDIASIRNEIRTAANHHVRPTPFYDVRVLKGPCDPIGLAADRAVVVVAVPYGQDAPYIHSRGVVYRRKADESDPVKETDRSRLDMLWERGRRVRSRLEQLLTEPPRLSESESNQSYMQLFLLTDPFGERGIRSRIGLEQFRRIMIPEHGSALFDIRMDSTFCVGDSFVARMTEGNAPYALLPSLTYRRDCSTVAIIPINGWAIEESHQAIREALSRYEQIDAFLDLLQPQATPVGAHVIDLTYMILLLMAFVGKHRALLEEERVRAPVMMKMHFGNLWRRVPFVDTPDYIEGVRRYGLPIIDQSSLLVPEGTDPASLLRTEPKDWRRPTEARPVVPSSVAAAIDALWALGVMGHAAADEADATAVGRRLIESAFRGVGQPLTSGWSTREP